MGLFDYDNSSIDSILKYTAENLIGRSLHDILEEFQSSEYKTYEDKKKGTPSTTTHKEISKLSKGIYGSLVEKLSYGIDPNNSPDPDIPAARVEIKTTPYRVNANGTISAKERLVLSMFNFHEENLDDFYQTHLWHKCQNILLLFYKYQKTRDILNNITDKFFLFDWPEEDMPTILEDYKRITQKVLEGRAHELSESDGMYLSTCRKGKGKDKDHTTQPYGPELANRRAWSLKPSYMTTLLRTIVFNENKQKPITLATEDTPKPFTKIIEEIILAYQGLTEAELCKMFGKKFIPGGRNGTKVRSIIINKIIKIPSGDKDFIEFQKANIDKIRTIRIKKNGAVKESLSFKNYNFKDYSQEKDDEWETSHMYTEVFSKKFIFVIFRENSYGEFYLSHIKFWGFPDSLESEFQRVWKETRSIIKQGVKLTVTESDEGNVTVSTNFPQSSVNNFIFTKIHADGSYYEIKPGQFIGNGKLADTDELPDGRRITKHSFWLSTKFIREIMANKWDHVADSE
ncbi:Sau3AI family type II restriction endonuclease [Rothia mucilaginosa]|uniref:Sau3AI family type II restriction endonuclease n=1 Tax=Rothia mucilaginosa TaxID=43675 RepID=UPI0028D775E6|nr:Sau3AI family type II restriction endonuclease [Rothia mucilaginosa]